MPPRNSLSLRLHSTKSRLTLLDSIASLFEEMYVDSTSVAHRMLTNREMFRFSRHLWRESMTGSTAAVGTFALGLRIRIQLGTGWNTTGEWPHLLGAFTIEVKPFRVLRCTLHNKHVWMSTGLGKAAAGSKHSRRGHGDGSTLSAQKRHPVSAGLRPGGGRHDPADRKRLCLPTTHTPILNH